MLEPRHRLWPTLVGASALVLWAVAIGVHLLAGPGIDHTGPTLVLGHIFDGGAVILLLIICAALGRAALVRLGFNLEGALESLLFATAFGTGLVATLFVLLGASGELSRGALALVLLLCGLVSWKALIELPRSCQHALSTLRPDDGSRVSYALIALLIVGLLLIPFAAAPPSDWDSLMYHLQIPARFLDQARVFLPEDNLHVSRIGLAHFAYLPLLASGSSAGPALFSLAGALLLALAVFAFCVRFFGRATAVLAVVLVWGTTTILMVAVTPRVDVTLSLFLFLSHYALLVALTRPAARHAYLVGGALLGFAVGVKLQALAYMIGLSPLIVWVALRHRSGRADAIRRLALFGSVAALAAAPWLIKNWVLIGAPLYPFLADPVLQPWLVPLFGTKVVPESIDRGVYQLVWEARQPFNIRDAFLAPGRISIESEAAYYFTNPALILLPMWVFFLRDRTISWLVLPAAAYLAVLLVPFPHTNLRYLLPAIVPLTIAVAHMAVTAAGRLRSANLRRLALTSIALLALVPSAKTIGALLVRTPALAHLAGVASSREYLASQIVNHFYVDMFSFANRELDPTSRILMLFDARGFYFENPVIQDNKITNWPFLAHILGPDQCLAGSNVTHVLVHGASVRYYLQGGTDPEPLRWPELQSFADRCLRPLYRNPTHVLFEVR